MFVQKKPMTKNNLLKQISSLQKGMFTPFLQELTNQKIRYIGVLRELLIESGYDEYMWYGVINTTLHFGKYNFEMESKICNIFSTVGSCVNKLVSSPAAK